MKKIHILFLSLMAVCMTSCYSHRVIGYLQEPTKHNKLPQYDSVAYEPYRIRVNDEIIYRLITMDQTIAKSLGANTNNVGGQYANSYRVYSDGTVDLPFLEPIKLQGLTEQEAQDTLKKAFREIIPDADVKVALYNKYFSVIGDANSSRYYIYKEKMNIFQALAVTVVIYESSVPVTEDRSRRCWSSISVPTPSSIRNTITFIPTM